MTERYISYSLDGDMYDVPESESANFERINPSAKIEMRIGEDVFDVPLSEKDNFLKINGDSVSYLHGDNTVKTNESDNDKTSIFETIGKGLGAAGAGTAKLALDLGQAAFQISPFGWFDGKKLGEAIQDESNPVSRASMKLGELQERLSREADPTGGQKGFVDLVKEGKIGMAAQKALGSGLESLPMMLAAGTGVGSVVYGAALAAGNYANETRENDDIPAWKRGINSVGSAVLEMAVEKIGGPLKNLGGKAGKEITEEMAKEAIERFAKDGTEMVSKRIFNVLKEGAEEGVEEIATSFGNDALGTALDLIDGDKDYGIHAQWEQMKEQNPDADLGDFAKTKAKEYLDSFLGGALSGMEISGTTDAIRLAVSSGRNNQIDDARNLGSRMGLQGMYDVNDQLAKSSIEVEKAFVGKDGNPMLSTDFINSLTADEAYQLSQEEDMTPAQKKALFWHARSKAVHEGLNEKLDAELNNRISAQNKYIDETESNGVVVTGIYNNQPVYVKGSVANNGIVTLPDGNNGPVIVINGLTGESTTVRTEDIKMPESINTDEYRTRIETQLRTNDAHNREVWSAKVSDDAKQRDVEQYANTKILINVGDKLVKVDVEKILPDGKVLIKGKKGDLNGQSELEIPATQLYDSIARNEDGSPVFVEALPQKEQETAEVVEEPVAEEISATEVTGEEDYRGENATILINGNPVNVEVVSQDNASNTISYEYVDENGNTRIGSSTIGDFKAALTTPTETTPEVEVTEETVVETPVEEPVVEEQVAEEKTELEAEDINWDALFEQDPEAFFVELQNQLGEDSGDMLNTFIQSTQEEIDSLSKTKGKTKSQIIADKKRQKELNKNLEVLNGMMTRLNAEPAEEPIIEHDNAMPESVEIPLQKDPEPMNGVEFAARELGLRNGGIKLLVDSFKQHTGYGSEEVKKFFGLFRNKDKGGITLEEAGERLMELDRENNTGFFDQNDPNAGMNAILDALSLNRTMGELRTYAAREQQAQAQKEANVEYSAMMAEYETKLGESVEDVVETEEESDEVIFVDSLTDEDYEEFLAIFTDESDNNGTDTNERETPAVSGNEETGDIQPSEGGVEGSSEAGNTVLQAEQPVHTRGEGGVEGESTEAGSEVSEQDVVPSVPTAEQPAVESVLDEDMPDFTTEAPKVPVAPNPVANPVELAQKEEQKLLDKLERVDLNRNEKRDWAYKYGKKVADMFATREDYGAYEEVAEGFGEFLNDFNAGVKESFANRVQFDIKERGGLVSDSLKSLGKLVASWIKQGGNVVVMDSAAMAKALESEGIAQNAKKRRRSLFNRDLTSAEKIAIQKYILSLPENHAQSMPYTLEYRGKVYVFNTSRRFYTENTTQNPIGDGFEILHRLKLSELSDAEKSLIKRYTDDRNSQNLARLLQLLESKQTRGNLGSSNTQYSRTATGNDGLDASEHRIESSTSGRDNSGRRDSKKSRALETREGVIYGFVKDGVVYLDPSLINPNTAIHEYTHLWDNALMQLNRPLWEKGKALMRQTPFWDEVINDPYYEDIKNNDDLVASEVHSRLVGEEGEARLNQLEQQLREESLTKSAKQLSILGRMREWLTEATKWLKDSFAKWTNSEIESVTLEDFVNLTMRDLVNFTNLSKITKIKTKEQIREEKASIKERAIADGTFMKAPNGKPTKLSEDQWLTVRTESFINWFGDWMNDPENASKVIDENGEPMVVYHGSPYGNIEEFNRKGHSVSGLREFGTYFGSNRRLAELYAYARQQAKGDIEKYELEKAKIDAIIFDPETPPRVALDAFDELDKLNESQKPKVYEVFLNIRHPKEFDAEKNNGYKGWHKLKQDVGYDIKTGVEAVEAIAGHNSAARMSEKYDGIIAHNMADVHHEEGLDELMGDVFLVFDETPSNIKSATGNTTFDSENSNIHFQIIGESSVISESRKSLDPTQVASETAKQVYDREVKRDWQEFQRQFQDAFQPVRIALDAIQQDTGNITIEDYENYLLIQNQSSSRSRAEIDKFRDRYYNPIINQLNSIIDNVLESRGLNKHDEKLRSEVYEEVRQYLIAKHGIERNQYYQSHKTRKLYEYEKKPLREEAKKDYDTEVNMINMNNNLTEAERQLKLREALDAYNATLTEIETREVPYMRDYSGLTALFNLDSKDFKKAEEMAQEMVDKFEALVDTEALWKKINKATDKTLRHSYESGLISRQQYNDIKSMFNFYVPLRGFSEDTAEDVYSYARFEGNRFNPAVQTAKGRTSLADDPIAIIMNMAESEIAQGNKNRAKQSLYYFLLNRIGANNKQNSLMQIEDVWYTIDTDEDGNTVQQIAVPNREKGETYEEFENKMQALAEEGKAAKSEKGKLDVGMRFQKQSNRNAHYVYLKINGVEKAIFVNGDPKAADAINGKNASTLGEGAKKFRDFQRFISSMFTNYSLEFTARNYFRDMIYSHINIDIVEPDPEYRKKFRQNWRSNNMRTMLKLLKAYRAGEFENRPLTETEAAFVEFMENGGQTGYTLINSVENHKKELQNAIERMRNGVEKGGIKDSAIFKATLGGVELLNEASELVTRFAAYKTSRDMGRGVVKSISDAKEITVNFNTRGAQDASAKNWMGAVASYFGWSKFFFNASVQGVQRIKAMADANKLKFCETVGGMIAAGFFMPIITSAIAELLGGDDEEEYWNIPEYDRQNNFCIPLGNGKYVKIPLPIGFREVYAIGDMVAAMLMDKRFRRDFGQIGMDMANKVASVVLPINPLESQANGLSIWHTALYTALPSSLQFAVQNATNIDWKGAPLQKEYTYNENDPQWMKAFASNPDWLTGLSKWCNEHINLDGDYEGMDWSPEKVDNILSNMFGGIYSLIKKSGKTISMIWNEENRNLSNVPLSGVVLGSGIESDDRFVTDAYYDMQDYYDANVNYIKRRAENFGYKLDDVFLKEKGKHHPKIMEIYQNSNFDFMQEWYKGSEELKKLQKEVKDIEKKIAEKGYPSEVLTNKLLKAKTKLENERREFVDDMLELD